MRFDEPESNCEAGNAGMRDLHLMLHILPLETGKEPRINDLEVFIGALR